MNRIYVLKEWSHDCRGNLLECTERDIQDYEMFRLLNEEGLKLNIKERRSIAILRNGCTLIDWSQNHIILDK
jgi:hypothetical protein